MAYQIEYKERPGYLYARVSGERTQDAVVALTREISQKANELGQSRILVDVRELTGWLQIMESNYIATTEFPKLRGIGIKKGAVLDRLPDEPQPLALFRDRCTK